MALEEMHAFRGMQRQLPHAHLSALINNLKANFEGQSDLQQTLTEHHRRIMSDWEKRKTG